MSIQRLSTKDALVLAHPGKRSEQFVSPRNALEATTTITRVTLLPRAVSKPHSHPKAEQIWIVESGSGLLLGQGEPSELKPGDIVRTPAGHVHGIENTGDGALVYISVTTPPEDFGNFYQEEG